MIARCAKEAKIQADKVPDSILDEQGEEIGLIKQG